MFSYINSSNNILNLKNQRRIHEKHNTNWEPMTYPLTLESVFDRTRKQIIKELVRTKHDTINAAGKHLRKTILRNHSSCIRRFVIVSKFVNLNSTPICPYAYAYVKWKQTLLHIDNYYDVDNQFYYVSNPERVSNLYLFNLDNDPLIQIINACIRSHPIMNPEMFSHIKWIITHMTWYVSILVFKSFLANPNTMPIEERLKLTNNFFAFYFPNRHDRPFSVILDKNMMNDDNHNLECPYHTVRLKRKSQNEKSFHPMKIAMENYSREVYNRASKQSCIIINNKK